MEFITQTHNLSKLKVIILTIKLAHKPFHISSVQNNKIFACNNINKWNYENWKKFFSGILDRKKLKKFRVQWNLFGVKRENFNLIFQLRMNGCISSILFFFPPKNPSVFLQNKNKNLIMLSRQRTEGEQQQYKNHWA